MVAFAGENQPLIHGGDLTAARRLFPGVVEPFIDLSTGINPNPYPLPRLTAAAFARLPSPAEAAALAEAAARAYGAPSAAHVVAAPGTQILLPLVASLVPAGRAAILAPTYGELTRAAALAGHNVVEVLEHSRLNDAQLVFVCNPNNPDGRLVAKNDLIALANDLRSCRGVLAVDEAFMDVGPPDASLCAEVGLDNIVVLRSFGKFFGLAGLRLGFAVTAPRLAARLAAMLGPWAVSGAALAVGAKALADTAWIEQTKTRLAAAAQRLDGLLTSAGLEMIGDTSLFRLTRAPAADALFRHLGRAGILVRAFPERPDWLRFGLPADEAAWQRLQRAMAAFGPGR